MRGTGQGCFVFSWSQVEVDGLAGAPTSTLHIGSTWRWQGSAMRVGDEDRALRLAPGEAWLDLKARAAVQARRMLGECLSPTPEVDEADEHAPRSSFSLTDGTRVFSGALMEGREGDTPLVMFGDLLPEPDCDYWVLSLDLAQPQYERAHGMICFVPGTLLDTPEGQRPVEEIRAGDRLGTRDDGPQEVLWRASRRISGGRIIAMPGLRPIRIRAGHFGVDSPHPELFVSPDHRILLRGRASTELFNETEVLVAARDLIGQPGILTDNRPRQVEYIHLMLARHQVLRANGVDCESFHPGTADLSALSGDERGQLETFVPGLARDPLRFGDFARRLLSRAEAALLLHGLGREISLGH